MEAKDLLKWIIAKSINGEFLNIIDVPEEGENEWQQNEEWWINQLGMYPPYPIEAGKYMYFYASQVLGAELEDPDAEIEICNADNMYGYDYIYLYKLED